MEYATECAVCKVYGSETLDYVADEAVQLHGGAGFIKEYKVEQMYRDSRINRIFEGTNEINRLLIPTHLYRKAANGEVNLEEMVQKALSELQAPSSEFTGVLGREQEAVTAFRRIFLVCAGIAFQTFGEKLQEEQETLMKLADIAIHLYASESAVFRTLKVIERNGLEKEKIKANLAAIYIDEAILNVEVIAKSLISGALTGEKMTQAVYLIGRECSRFIQEGSNIRKHEVADHLNKHGQYKV